MELSLGLRIGDLGELPIVESEDDDIWRPKTSVPENEVIPLYEIENESEGRR